LFAEPQGPVDNDSAAQPPTNIEDKEDEDDDDDDDDGAVAGPTVMAHVDLAKTVCA
jgi:hypothetical protein